MWLGLGGLGFGCWIAHKRGLGVAATYLEQRAVVKWTTWRLTWPIN